MSLCGSPGFLLYLLRSHGLALRVLAEAALYAGLLVGDDLVGVFPAALKTCVRVGRTLRSLNTSPLL